MNFKRPMLAASLLPSTVEHTDNNILAAMEKLHYWVLATIKKDGIRFLKMDDLLSRTLKLIPNISIRKRASVLPYGYDGELYNPELSYEQIESIVMSRVHPDSDKIQFHILDNFNIEGANYQQRIWSLEKDLRCHSTPPYTFGIPVLLSSPQQLLEWFLACEVDGHEGICFRTPMSPYKQGRSTLKEQYLVKLCRFHTSECIIEGYLEQQENGNPDEWNDVGMMKRTSHQENMIGKGTLGAFWVRDIHSGVEFKIGTGVGLGNKLRKEIWMNRDKYSKTIWKYKYKGGGKNKPRSPILLGQRKEIDIC